MIIRRCGHYRLRSGATGVVAVAVERQSDNDGERNSAAEEAWLFVPTMRHRLARRTDGRTGGAIKVPRPFFSMAVDLDFECESFSDSWTVTIFRKCRNMDKDFRTTLNWRNESEASIVIPLGQIAFYAHIEGLTFKVRLTAGLGIAFTRDAPRRCSTHLCSASHRFCARRRTSLCRYIDCCLLPRSQPLRHVRREIPLHEIEHDALSK